MKPAVLLATVCATLSVPALAQITVSSGQVVDRTGSVLEVSYRSQGTPVAALQFDIRFDDSVLNIETVAGAAIRDSAKDLYVSSFPNRRRIVIAGMNSTPVSNGVLLKLFVSVVSASVTEDQSVSLEEITGVAADSGSVPLEGVDGVVALTGPSSGTGISRGNVVNAASLLPGPITPGEMITVFGSAFLPDQDAILEDVEVRFDGLTSPIVSFQSNRFTAIVPPGAGAAGGQSTVVEVRHGRELRASAVLPMAPAAPGLFTASWTGVGQAAAVNEDGSLNSAVEPAIRGGWVFLFATGISLEPEPVVSVRIAQQVLAPGYVLESLAGSGVWIVAVQLPEELPAGRSVPVTLSVSNASSQTGVTIAIR